MNKKHLLGYLVASTVLVACGGESTSNAPDLNINITYPDGGGSNGDGDGGDGGAGGVSTIVNTALPIEEDFGASDTLNFFSDNYKALASEAASAEEDNFYYSAAGLFVEEGGAVADPQNTWITADADPAIRFGNSRWTIGQTVSSLAAFPADGSARNKGTPGNATDTSWGELDLSTPYTISFCVVDITEGGNLQVYIDNTTSSRGSSIHGNDSLIYTSGASVIPKGQRLVINSEIGTANSFIQFRMDSGGAVVIDDLIIENAGAPATTPPDCSTKTTAYLANQTGEEVEVPVTGAPFTGIPAGSAFSVDFTVGKDEFFGIGEAETFVSISNDVNDPFYKVTSGNEKISIADGKLSMANARFTIGDKGTATAAEVNPAGDIDLSAPYRIAIVISDFTDADASDAAGKFQVYVDNNTTSSSNSLHGGASKLVEIAVDDGTITTLPHTLVIEPDAVATANSFLQLRADSRVGNLTIDSISIEYIGDAPVNDDAVLSEAFDATDTANFMSIDYKTLPTDPTKPMYEATGGASQIVVAGGELAMFNARFTVGNADNTQASAADTTPLGALDLSKPYTITFTVKAFDDDTDTTNAAGKFQVYVDNNTTSSSNSTHGGSSKLLEIAQDDGTITTFPHTVVINSELGTATSFLQFRADSRVGNLVIDDLTIEYQ